MVDLGYLFSVSALALLGMAILRRLRVSVRWISLIPLVLSVAIIWCFGDITNAGDVISQGIASGLLAVGVYHLCFGMR